MAMEAEWGTILDDQAPFIPVRYPSFIEREYMNPIRYKTNYRLVPGFGIFAILCGGIGLVLISMDMHKYLPAFLGLVVLILAVFAVMMVVINRIAKQEMEMECARFDFDYSKVEDRDSYVIPYEQGDVELTREGYIRNGEFHSYEEVKPKLTTSHTFNRVWLAIQLGEKRKYSLFLHLDPTVIKAVKHLEIPLENADDLRYLLKYPREACEQVYREGKFYVLDRK